MNIFYLDSNPLLAAQYQCDKHIVKMVLESAQMLCTAHWLLESRYVNEKFYRLTHPYHPSCKWTRETSGNYNWLYCHFLGLCDEYRFRYGKIHLTGKKLRDDLARPPDSIPLGEITLFAMAIPEQFKSDCPIESYRAYYQSKSKQFKMTWTKRVVPNWFALQQVH